MRCPHCNGSIVVVAAASPLAEVPTRGADPAMRVVAAAAAAIGVKPSQVLRQDKHRAVTLARHIAAYVLRESRGMSYPEIGRVLGQSDHSSAMHAVKRIERLLEAGDERVREAIATVSRATSGSPQEEMRDAE